MKKYILKFAFTALFLSVFVGCAGNAPVFKETGKLRACASFYPIYDFASKIGGEKIEVVCVVPFGAEIHEWDLSSADVRAMREADVFFYHGGAEIWIDAVLASGGGNAVCVAENITAVPGDPHTWLDPKNAKIEMGNIKDALAAADPENAAYYAERYDRYAAECDALDGEYRNAAESFTKTDIVVSHAAYAYLCEAYGLTQTALRTSPAEDEPGPARMAQIVDFMRKNDVRVIFYNELEGKKTEEAIARDTGAKLLPLSPVEGLTGAQAENGDDYFSLMRKNLAALKEALG